MRAPRPAAARTCAPTALIAAAISSPRMTEDPAVLADAATVPNVTFHYTDFPRTNAGERGLAPEAVASVLQLLALPLRTLNDTRAAGFGPQVHPPRDHHVTTT